MRPQEIELVQTSWKTISKMGDSAIEVFYDRLFAKAPYMRSLFPEDMRGQRTVLMQTLAFCVAGFANMEQVADKVRDLGARHTEYGAKPEYFAVVGETLIETFAEVFHESWGEELTRAWQSAFSTLARIMIEAQEQSAAA